ncbi:uncharacterized protein LOC132943354 [Metopolophium dirhodum]|uniref:uncharacterized protein LOC132943354 n=1 Tax=Metopolophium dirhodum TaxID=44670 RepID=UPI00298F77E0|nr:uncharacterized protein LOC132943354 [Metopolophium dirhodum]XP_060868303.1 uncharacterized protein LOC132943354 [Metopolophium dirhodum]
MTSGDHRLRPIGPTSCPPATRRTLHSSSSAVRKVDDGVSVWGVTVRSNCQIALPVFGTLFLFAGIVLTVISYGWVTGGGEDDSKRKFYPKSDNGRILGPICLVVSIVMFIATAVLRTISTNARFRQTRVGFHCPVHGDFFPISPGPDPRKFSFSTENLAKDPWRCNCLNRPKADSQETLAVEDSPPQCPHNGVHGSTTRSPSPVSTCPTPKPFLIFTDSAHGACKELYSGNTLFPDEPFGSIRSLSVPNDNLTVACFPVERSSEQYLNVPEDAWSHKRLSCPSLPSAGDEFPQPVHKPLTPQVVKVTREIKFVTPIDKSP